MKRTYAETFQECLNRLNKHFEEKEIPCLFTIRSVKSKEPFKLYTTEEQFKQATAIGAPTETTKYRYIRLYRHNTTTGERTVVYERIYVYDNIKEVLNKKHLEGACKELMEQMFIQYFEAAYFAQ